MSLVKIPECLSVSQVWFLSTCRSLGVLYLEKVKSMKKIQMLKIFELSPGCPGYLQATGSLAKLLRLDDLLGDSIETITGGDTIETVTGGDTLSSATWMDFAWGFGGFAWSGQVSGLAFAWFGGMFWGVELDMPDIYGGRTLRSR